MPLLQVKNIAKSFEGVEIINESSLEVNAGDTIAFVSPSGSGKSTMLSMIGLLLAPDSGQIVIDDGRNALDLDDRELSRLRQRLFGFVFQSTQLIGSLRAIENVTAPAGFASKLDFDVKKRACELLEQFGLGERMYHYPHQLSVGQKRRVAVARALLLKPKILIADEPTNDLDEQSAKTVADALFDYAEQGNALLYATHVPSLAKRAKKTMVLREKSFVAE